MTVFGIQYVGSIGKMLSYDINDNAARPNKVWNGSGSSPGRSLNPPPSLSYY